METEHAKEEKRREDRGTADRHAFKVGRFWQQCLTNHKLWGNARPEYVHTQNVQM